MGTWEVHRDQGPGGNITEGGLLTALQAQPASLARAWAYLLSGAVWTGFLQASPKGSAEAD